MSAETRPSSTAARRSALLCAFKALHGTPPAWAWPVAPSVPFIGNRYGRGLLVYASAENLSWMNSRRVPRYESDAAWDRYRAAYADEGRDSKAFFPTVGIAPVEDGGLLAAALFVAERAGLPTATEPRPFLETLAVSNWCKFAIRTDGENRDYIADVKKLTASLPFVVAEMAELKPSVVLVPKAVWRHPILSAAMRGAAPGARFLPVPQFNPRVVNIHLRKYDRAGRTLRESMTGTPLAEWMGHLHGFNAENAWRYLAFLATAASPRNTGVEDARPPL